MTSAGNLKPLKCKLHIASFLMYHTPVMLALKCFICTLLLAFKSPNTLFAALFDVFYLLIHHKCRMFVLKLANFKRNVLLCF